MLLSYIIIYLLFFSSIKNRIDKSKAPQSQNTFGFCGFLNKILNSTPQLTYILPMNVLFQASKRLFHPWCTYYQTMLSCHVTRPLEDSSGACEAFAAWLPCLCGCHLGFGRCHQGCSHPAMHTEWVWWFSFSWSNSALWSPGYLIRHSMIVAWDRCQDL